jgi:phage/plasmid-associated DNA primase
MRTDNDAVQAFIDDACSVDEKWNPNSAKGSVIETRAELYTAYESYCRREERETLGKIKFFKALQSKGFEAVRSNGEPAFFKGIATKETLKRFRLIPKDS